jgi:hypothetical protein
MKKSIITFVAFAFLTLSSTNVKAGWNSGNYVNEGGCLVVWSSYSIWGITVPFTSEETIFCNDDGSSVNFGG